MTRSPKDATPTEARIARLAAMSPDRFALALDPYHDGGHIYAVVSNLYAGHQPERKSVLLAIKRLRNARAEASFPGAIKLREEREMRALAEALVRRFSVSAEELETVQ